MLYEMTFDAVKPGGMPRYLALFGESALPLMTQQAELLGAWTTEFGAVNQLVCLWRHRGFQERLASLDALAASQELRPLLMTRSVELLKSDRPVEPQTQPGKLYELRVYTVAPGRVDEFVRNMNDIIPVRQKYNRNLAVWSPYAGELDRVFHFWLYDDLSHRERVRAACASDPEWKVYLTRNVPITLRRVSSLLVPTAFSPMR